MSDTGGPDLEMLARDWITLWQSELSALAAEPEAQEGTQAALALWANVLTMLVKAAAHDPAACWTPAAATWWAAATPGAPAAAAASDARDAEIDRLSRHVDDLEARLAALEHGSDSGGAGGERG